MKADLDRLFAAAKAEGRAVFLPYLMAGIPDLESSVSMFEAMAEAGADGFEVGLPYADPLMDGPVIQRAGKAALGNGTTVERGLEILRAVVDRTAKPCVVMTYTNPVLRYGAADFARRVAEAGGSGVIVADLPVDESGPIHEAVEAAGLGMVLFAAPTTSEERLRLVADAHPVFVYGVAEMGVTGERDRASDRAGDLAARVRVLTDTPLVLGVGISGPDAARAAAAVADGFIVGTALVRRVLDAPDAAAARVALSDAVGEFAAAARR